nr:SCF ubiquitin ligase complex protein SKP1a-like [Cherax quadricarinatus]
METLKLKSSDGDIFIVDTKVACMSNLLTEMINCIEASNDDEVIPFDNINTPILKMVIDYLNTAHFLDIKSLEQVTCKMIANEIKGKTTEQIRQMFKIENDFTPAEEELKHNTEWVKEKLFTCPDHPI